MVMEAWVHAVMDSWPMSLSRAHGTDASTNTGSQQSHRKSSSPQPLRGGVASMPTRPKTTGAALGGAGGSAMPAERPTH